MLLSALGASQYKEQNHEHSSHFKIEKMNGTFFLVSQWEFENTFIETEMEPVLTYRSMPTNDEKSIEDPVPKNRSECLIW